MLGLVVRDGKGNLDFQRELHRLTETVYRNFAVAIGDCHFERSICNHLRAPHHPVLYLFVDGKLVRWTTRDEFTLEKFLDFLSSDNYIEQSIEVNADSASFIKGVLGQQVSFYKKITDVWAKEFEQLVEKKSKAVFAYLGLWHWNMNTKMVLCMLAFFCPICFSLIGGVVFGIITCYNQICEFVYDKKLAAL